MASHFSRSLDAWIVWKNSANLGSGLGDVDAVLPELQWPEAIETFSRWAGERGLDTIVTCRHLRGVMFLIGLCNDNDRLIELDLCATQPFRGSVLFQAETLIPFAVEDSRGFRRLRSGAEGLLSLLMRAPRWGAVPSWHDSRLQVIVDAIRDDHEAALALSSALRGGWGLESFIQGLVKYEWRSHALRRFEARSAARSIMHLPYALARVRTHLLGWPCPVVASCVTRTMGASAESWRRDISSTHRLLAVT